MRLAALLLLTTITVLASDATGKWTSSFDTQIGPQSYTFDFKVDGNKLTGTATNKGNGGGTEIQEGKVDGDTLSFVENFTYEGNQIRIEYTGKIDAGGDRIQFTRKVAEYAVEQIVANRVK